MGTTDSKGKTLEAMGRVFTLVGIPVESYRRRVHVSKFCSFSEFAALVFPTPLPIP